MKKEEYPVRPTGEIIKEAMEKNGVTERMLVDRGIPSDMLHILLASRQKLTSSAAGIFADAMPGLSEQDLLEHDRRFYAWLHTALRTMEPVVFRVDIPADILCRDMEKAILAVQGHQVFFSLYNDVLSALREAISASYMKNGKCTDALVDGEWFDWFGNGCYHMDMNERMHLLLDAAEGVMAGPGILKASFSLDGAPGTIRVHLILDLGKDDLIDQMKAFREKRAECTEEYEK